MDYKIRQQLFTRTLLKQVAVKGIW